MSDPFQPVELIKRKTLDALKVFAETQYPFIISTKSRLIADEPYLSLIKQCNCVVQISVICREYDAIEQGASPFVDRLEAIRKISPYKRVLVRLQPYLPEMQLQILKTLKEFADAGAYGVIIEGMKYIKRMAGTIRLGGDNVYPAKLLREHYERIRGAAHTLGMRFYCAENRLRTMGDSLCCCGIDGMGWKVNTGNLVHMLYDAGGVFFSNAQRNNNVSALMTKIKQSSIAMDFGRGITFEELIKTAYRTKAELRPLIPEK